MLLWLMIFFTTYSNARIYSSSGAYDGGYMLPSHPLSAGMTGPPFDPRVLVHWNHAVTGNQPPTNAAISGQPTKSDEDDEDDDGNYLFYPSLKLTCIRSCPKSSVEISWLFPRSPIRRTILSQFL